MQYFATHYWHSDERDGTSLVLQQAFHKRKRMPVLLACIHKSEQGKGTFSQKAVEWFYGNCLELCGKNGEKGIEAIERALSDFLKQVAGEGEYNHMKFEVTGMLIVGRTFIIFRKGSQRIQVINTRNHRSYCSEIAEEQADEIVLQTGIIQKGVGILLTTDTFNHTVSRGMVEDCLNIRELRAQEQIDKRLRELGNVAKQYSKSSVGALLIVSH